MPQLGQRRQQKLASCHPSCLLNEILPDGVPSEAPSHHRYLLGRLDREDLATAKPACPWIDLRRARPLVIETALQPGAMNRHHEPRLEINVGTEKRLQHVRIHDPYRLAANDPNGHRKATDTVRRGRIKATAVGGTRLEPRPSIILRHLATRRSKTTLHLPRSNRRNANKRSSRTYIGTSRRLGTLIRAQRFKQKGPDTNRQEPTAGERPVRRTPPAPRPRPQRRGKVPRQIKRGPASRSSQAQRKLAASGPAANADLQRSSRGRALAHPLREPYHPTCQTSLDSPRITAINGDAITATR